MKKGFSIVEVMLAATLFVIFATGLVIAVLSGLNNNQLAAEQTIANQYATEGLEVARGQGFANVATVSSTFDKYSRTVAFNLVDANTKKVTSTVNWDVNSARANSVVLTTYLTDWFAAINGGNGSQIAYYDFTNKALKYASCVGNCTIASNWTPTTVDIIHGGDKGQDTSIAIYGGKPRISYYDANTHDLNYVTCDANCTSGSSWTQITVDSSSTDVGWQSSLVLDSSGNPRISYYDNKNQQLKYAFCNTNCTTATNWTLVVVNTNGNVGQYSSLVLDGSGNPNISYYDVKNHDLLFSACTTNCQLPASWSTTLIDNTSNDEGRYSSLKLDSGGDFLISYYDFQNHDLRFASCQSSCTTAANWTKVTIDNTSGDVGQYSALAVDGIKPRIAYYDAQNKTLKYASCDANCTTASNWTKITVDSLTGGDVGKYSFIALDGSMPRISYYDTTNKDLKQAACSSSCTTPSSWTKTVIDSAGDVGMFNSM